MQDCGADARVDVHIIACLPCLCLLTPWRQEHACLCMPRLHLGFVPACIVHTIILLSNLAVLSSQGVSSLPAFSRAQACTSLCSCLPGTEWSFFSDSLCQASRLCAQVARRNAPVGQAAGLGALASSHVGAQPVPQGRHGAAGGHLAAWQGAGAFLWGAQQHVGDARAA